MEAEHLLEVFSLGMAGEEGDPGAGAGAASADKKKPGLLSGLSALDAYRRLLFKQWRDLMALCRLSAQERAAVDALRATAPASRHPVARVLPEPMQDGARGIIPAFFRFVESQLLDPATRDTIAIVIRTFGTDIADIGTEWNMYCTGQHPYERIPKELGLLDGSGPTGIDMRLMLPSSTAMIHRSGYRDQQLSVAVVSEDGPAPACAQLVGYRALDGWIRNQISSGRRCLAVRDCYSFWNEQGEAAGAGKVVMVDATAWGKPPPNGKGAADGSRPGADGGVASAAEDEVHPVFFDDNVLRRRAKIVDARVILPAGCSFRRAGSAATPAAAAAGSAPSKVAASGSGGLDSSS